MSLTRIVCLIFILVLFAKPMKAYSQAGADMSVEEFLQRLSSVRRVLDRRDPFEETVPSFAQKPTTTIVEETRVNAEEAIVEINADDVPPLQRYNAKEYIVIATLLGNSKKAALVKMPERAGTAELIYMDQRIGNKGGKVVEISQRGIVVEERIKNTFGSFDDIRTDLPVGGF